MTRPVVCGTCGYSLKRSEKEDIILNELTVKKAFRCPNCNALRFEIINENDEEIKDYMLFG